MLFFHLYKIFSFTFCVLLYIIMYILNIVKRIKKISVNDIIDFIFENYYKRIGFSKETSYYVMKWLKGKDWVMLKIKVTQKVSLIITYQPKTFDNVDTTSVITEHPKTSLKLSKTIRQVEKVSSSSSLYSDIK